MTGVVIHSRFEGFGEVTARLGRLSAFNRTLVLDQLGQVVEMQVKKRIASEKTAPDGSAWKPNRQGTPILVQQGFLRDSIHHAVEGSSSVRVGSNLIYAAIHQTGGTIVPKKARLLVFRVGGKTVAATKVTIPARPYLGFSAANRVQIERHLVTLVRQYLNAI